MEVIKEVYCKKCGVNTRHQFKYHIMDIQEEKEANETALKEIEEEDIGGKLLVKILRWSDAKSAIDVAEEVWNLLDLDKLNELRGKDVYVCCDCGEESYV